MQQPQTASGRETMARAESNKFQSKVTPLHRPYTSKPRLFALPEGKVHSPHNGTVAKHAGHPSVRIAFTSPTSPTQLGSVNPTRREHMGQFLQLVSRGSSCTLNQQTQSQTNHTASTQGVLCYQGNCYAVHFYVYKRMSQQLSVRMFSLFQGCVCS